MSRPRLSTRSSAAGSGAASTRFGRRAAPWSSRRSTWRRSSATPAGSRRYATAGSSSQAPSTTTTAHPPTLCLHERRLDGAQQRAEAPALPALGAGMNRIWLVLRKDALVLRRSPLLFGILIAYPVAIALLVGLVAGYASSKPRVALVDEDNLPATVLSGGKRTFLGEPIDVIGLQRSEKLLHRMPQTHRVHTLEDFVHDARLALANTGDALRATAHPIQIAHTGNRGRTSTLSAQVQANAIALTITFLALMLAAGSLAAERDENVIGRLARGLVGLGHLVWAKVLLASAVALVLGVAIAVAFGVIIDVGGVTGGEPWQRLPLLVVGLALAGGALGALGALLGTLAREARSASLVALLVVLPIVFLGLIPAEVVPPAGWASTVLPFSHAVSFFRSALFDLSPWGGVLRQGLWLLALGGIFGVLARLGARRLLA